MRFAIAGLVAILALVGCDRVVSSTDLAADTSYVRTVKFSHATNPGMPDETKVSDLIRLEGEGWTKSTETKDANETLTATRKVQAGAGSVLESTLTVKGKAYLEARVEAKKLPSGEIDYTETYTWVGPKSQKNADTETANRDRLLKTIKQALPSLTESQAADLEAVVEDDLMKALLGPSQPMLMSIVTQPELASKQIRGREYQLIVRFLTDQKLVDAVSAAKAARQIAGTSLDDKALASNTPTPPSDPNQKNDDPGMTLVQSEVKFTGTIVQADGETDPVDGSVYWAFYAGAAERKPVKLHAIIRP